MEWIRSIFAGLVDGFSRWWRDAQAKEDAIVRDRAEQHIKNDVKARADKDEVDAAGRKAKNDPDPDMADWN